MPGLRTRKDVRLLHKNAGQFSSHVLPMFELPIDWKAMLSGGCTWPDCFRSGCYRW